MKKEGHQSLSTKSLTKVWDWCHANSDNPMSKIYITACCTCGGIQEEEEIPVWLKADRRESDYRHITEWFKAYDAAFECRDIIGRIILDNIKRIDRMRKKKLEEVV